MYIDIQELNTLISQVCTPRELESIKWDTILDGTKHVLILKATLCIDSLQYRGRKADTEQENKFPRVIRGKHIGVPNKVKYATVRKIYELVKDEVSVRRQLQRDGVKSFSTGVTSESYVDNKVESQVENYIIDMYLKSYIFNGVYGS